MIAASADFCSWRESGRIIDVVRRTSLILSIPLALSVLLTASEASANPFSVYLAPPDEPAPQTPSTSAAPPPAEPQPAKVVPPTTTAPPAEPPQPETTEPPQPDPVADPPPEAGPEGADPPADGAAADGAMGDPTADPTTGGELSLDESREGTEQIKTGFNQHGIGVRAGLTVIPTWILSGFLASHTNALCRGDAVQGFAEANGVTKMGGCNYYIGAEYVYRRSRVFDIVASAGYQRLKTPDGFWLDKDEWPDGCEVQGETVNGVECDLAAADYTEVDFGFVFIEADFIGRFPIVGAAAISPVKSNDVEWSIGGGGGIGVGIVVGKGVFQTPIGQASPDNPATCNQLSDFSDFTKCTPHYWDDPDIDQDGDGNLDDPDIIDPSETEGEGQFAKCTADACNIGDLQAFGSRKKQADIPPVIPVVNLILTTRVIIKDTFGINITGGWNTGFYFGGSLQFFFGGGGKESPVAKRKNKRPRYNMMASNR